MATITLKKLPSVAPKGQNRGVFSSITPESGQDKLGNDYSNLKTVVTLDAQDPDGKPYTVEKSYNLRGRGVQEFQGDFRAWTGRLLTDQELDAFDGDAEMNGKPVIVELKHAKLGKKIVAKIVKFHPATPPATGS